jgi:penicillin-binding protein 1C
MTKPKTLISLTLVTTFVSIWAIIFFAPIPPLLNDISFSRAVYANNQQDLLRLTLSRDDKYRLYTPLSNIAPQLIQATLLEEDQYFRWHYGINPLAIIKAGWQTYIVKTRRIGASTITMQLARIRFNLNSKTLTGKFQQLIRALQLEMHYSKNQILEAYLNLSPYGNNIEGVGAASLIYFGKPAAKLSLPEALTLSVIPQHPALRATSQHHLKEVRNKLFKRWLVLHPNDQAQQALMELPLQIQSVRNLPFLAPHFVDAVLQNSSCEQWNIITTLDLRLQQIVEHTTQHYLSQKKPLGIYNAAVLLVDTRTMQVKALQGSADFFNKNIQGQINGTDIKRSPGSTLKPFIYGLALDQGLIHPNTVLKDVPHSFGSYNPENFDYDFMGPIKAKDALVLSRNIPAIYLADKLAKPDLYQLLEAAQIRDLKPQAYYGLALVLGGAELSMQELTSLYAMLANDGVWHPLQLLQNQATTTGKRLLSPEASFLVLDMLQNTPRLSPSYLSEHQSLPVAWKTGTSSGYRDAWSVAVFGPYVLAVWIGNFDNSGNAALVGRSVAAPLLFDIIDAVNSQTGPLPLMKKNPERLHLARIAVCKASGMLPTRNCQDTELTWFIPGKSPIKTDTIFRAVAINKLTGLRACQPDQNTQFKVFEFWSSDLLKIFKQAGIERRSPPAYETNCTMAKSSLGLAPQITSPQTDLSYVIRMQSQRKSLIPLTATVDADVENIYWFANETYLGKTTRDKTFWWTAKPGKFIIRAADDHGRSDARDVIIRLEG